MGNWKENVNDAIFYIRKKAGQCAKNATLKDIDDAVSLAQERIGMALTVGAFLQNSATITKLKDANEKLGDLSAGISKARSACVFIGEAGEIMDAVKELSDPQIIYNNPTAAAEAFDTLFRGFGKVCQYLPPPAKQWSKFFEEFNLFSSFARIADPEKISQHREQWEQMGR